MNLELKRHRALLAFFPGVILVLATPPFKFGFLAWFALIPLFFVLEKASSFKESFALGLFFGFPFHLGTLYWITMNTGADMFSRLASGSAVIVILTLWFGVLAVGHRLLLVAYGEKGHYYAIFLWTAQEVVRSYGELGFPWNYFSLTQANYLPVLQMSAVGGAPLISAWVVTLNAILTAGRKRRSAAFIVALMLLLAWGVGTLRERMIRTLTSRHTIGRIALLQGNIDPSDKWNLGAEFSFDIYVPLSNSIRQESPDLIVWPETAAPVRIQNSPFWCSYMQNLVDSLNLPLATGAAHNEVVDDILHPYNASFLIVPDGGGDFKSYFKVHLVPFGERVPFQWLIPSLGKLNFGQAEFLSGPGVTIWSVQTKSGQFKTAPLICYEAIFSELWLKAIKLGAQVMINMTNDGWMRGTSEPEQHLLLSRIRSIESGRSLVRATNTGISAIIGPSGFILQRLEENIRGALVTDIPSPVNTPFLRFGFVTSFVFLGLAVVVLVIAIRKVISNSSRSRMDG